MRDGGGGEALSARRASVRAGGSRGLAPCTVLHRSLASVEIDARRLCRRNAKALRLTIEQSEREAEEELEAKAKAAPVAKEQACAPLDVRQDLLHRLRR